MDQHLLFPRSSTHGAAMEMAAPEVRGSDVTTCRNLSGLQDHEDVGGQEPGRQNAEFLLELSNSRQTQ